MADNSQRETYTEERPWGKFERITLNETSTVKIITVSKNEALSLQSHSSRDEFWEVLAGSGTATIGERKISLEPGIKISAGRGEKHRLEAGPEGLVVLEVAFGQFDENDIVRFEDRYKRI